MESNRGSLGGLDLMRNGHSELANQTVSGVHKLCVYLGLRSVVFKASNGARAITHSLGFRTVGGRKGSRANRRVPFFEFSLQKHQRDKVGLVWLLYFRAASTFGGANSIASVDSHQRFNRNNSWDIGKTSVCRRSLTG